MALYNMCTVLDMVGQQYGRPFFAVSEGSAIRGFSDEINRSSDSVLHSHPQDFQLFVLGTFEDTTCTFEMEPTPRLLVSGSQLVEPTAPAKA